MSAYQFALDHKEDWRVKLSADKRHEVLSQSALKSAQVRSDNSRDKREHAKSLRASGETLSAIASLLDVSSRTIMRWLK